MPAATELILNGDGSVYHLGLLPGDIADTIIAVGDPDRVGKVSRYFDRVELKKQRREFTTHTGTLRGRKISAMSTGIGTDNVEIFLMELDALVNMDLKTKVVKSTVRQLEIVRIGKIGRAHV